MLILIGQVVFEIFESNLPWKQFAPHPSQVRPEHVFIRCFPNPPHHSWLKSEFPSDFLQEFVSPQFDIIFCYSIICATPDISTGCCEHVIWYFWLPIRCFSTSGTCCLFFLHLLLISLISSLIQNINCGCYRSLSELYKTYTNPQGGSDFSSA